jgi:hypothetical protein
MTGKSSFVLLVTCRTRDPLREKAYKHRLIRSRASLVSAADGCLLATSAEGCHRKVFQLTANCGIQRLS